MGPLSQLTIKGAVGMLGSLLCRKSRSRGRVKNGESVPTSGTSTNPALLIRPHSHPSQCKRHSICWEDQRSSHVSTSRRRFPQSRLKRSIGTKRPSSSRAGCTILRPHHSALREHPQHWGRFWQKPLRMSPPPFVHTTWTMS